MSATVLLPLAASSRANTEAGVSELCSKCTDLGAPVFENIKVLIDNFKNKCKDDDHVNRKTLRRD